MTLHAAKGLEFSSVFLPGWEDGLFPSQRSLDESGQKGLEEERRLAYVGITRAEKHCTISFAANRRIYNQWQSAIPSRFIDNLSKEDVEVVTPPALYGGNFGVAAKTFNTAENIPVASNSKKKEYLSNLNSANSKVDVYNSPGWKRMKSQSKATPAPHLFAAPIDVHARINLDIGQKVFHQKFGYGFITLVDGNTVSVSFKKSGDKKVRVNYLLYGDNMP